MSAFQVTITPTRLKKEKRAESREPTDVVMAPFSSKAIVQFEDVPVTKTAKRTLRIINTSEDSIVVKVTKSVPAAYNASIDWNEHAVPAQGEVAMEMVWTPLFEVACKETLQLMDNRNFRKDVMIIFKSKSNKPVKSVRKFPTVTSGNAHAKTLRMKSPKGGGVKNNRNSPVNHQKKRTQRVERITLNPNGATMTTTTTNNRTQRQKTPESSPLFMNNFLIKKTTTTTTTTSYVSPANLSYLANSDLKENISPLTPDNVLSLIDKMKFTPATETISRAPRTMEELASLPTPIAGNYVPAEITEERMEIRPRRLTTAELMMESDRTDQEVERVVEAKSFVIAPNNKTFELPTIEIQNASSDTLDSSALGESPHVGVAFIPDGITLNKTTVISNTTQNRALEMIAEEETGNSFSLTHNISSNGGHQNGNKSRDPISTGNGSNDMDLLKRSIQLVGTPLRKYSESMSNLLTASPQAKLGVQGSMPNLNDFEGIRSIEHNRYFYQSTSSMASASSRNISNTSTPSQNNPPPPYMLEDPLTAKPTMVVKSEPLDDSTASNSSGVSSISQADSMFNHNEILAQSSRFNLNEVGLSNTRRWSPRTRPLKIVDNPSNNQLRTTTTTKSAATAKTSYTIKTEKVDKLQRPSAMDTSNKKRKSQYLSDSPSTESSVSLSHLTSPTTKPVTRAKPDSLFTFKADMEKVSPPKRQRFDIDYSFARPMNVSSSLSTSGRFKLWSQADSKKLKLARNLSLVKNPITPRKVKLEPRVRLYDSDVYLQTCINPDPFAATTTCDPFLASTMYLDERALDRHRTDFKKWLNALVTIPADLATDCNTKIDVGKLFNEVRHKELSLAPSKEQQSNEYLTHFRLQSLRRSAVQLFLGEEMRLPCSKVAVYVNKNALRIRSDRNLHLDVVMQRNILELLLCFNPLWLRLGLEVVYGEQIHLSSNNDVVGLTSFILNRLFRDKYLEQKYSKAYAFSEEYADHIKKLTLQKMLFLLLFLDRAKSARIIEHNPCLFVKKSPYKETREILLKFASELLANLGDITRDLKRLGYVLQHKQSFLDEFDYAFNNLAVDLRDGIRLTRVMEIILLRDDLSRQLRVPAISRLQRVFNVNLALRALNEADFQLKGEIVAADIVDGHREKTLSLLWQIIYKFRSPKFHASARVLQQWWRRKWFAVCIDRRIRVKLELRRHNAAAIIQALVRGRRMRRWVKQYREERTAAALVLQKNYRRHLVQRRLRRESSAAVTIQRWYRARVLGRKARNAFVKWRTAAILLQRFYRRRVMGRKLLIFVEWMAAEERRMAAQRLQSFWRSICAGRRVRAEFMSKRNAVIALQRRFRARLLMKEQMATYTLTRQAIVRIQRRWRATMLMRQQRAIFKHQRDSICRLQGRYRARLQMKQQMAVYKRERNIIIVVQQKWRAKLLMRRERIMYEETRQVIIHLQRRVRARRQGRLDCAIYQRHRQAIITIQRRWRGKLQKRRDQGNYLRLRKAAIVLQRRWRARLLLREKQRAFAQLRQKVVIVQRRWRANQEMRVQRANFQSIQKAAVCLQECWRGRVQTRREQLNFQELRKAAVVLQRAYRSRLAMCREQANYQQLRAAAVAVQRRYRAKLQMRQQRALYEHQKSLIINIQQRYKAKLLGRRVRADYQEQLQAIVCVQRRYRAQIAMQVTRSAYLEAHSRIVRVQQLYRATLEMRKSRQDYQRQKQAALTMQRAYRAQLEKRRDQANFQRLRTAAITVQRRYRAKLQMRQQRSVYAHQRSLIITIQQRYRAKLLGRQVRAEYLLQLRAIVCVQQRFCALVEMRIVRKDYLRKRSAIVALQRRIRAQQAMRRERATYEKMRNAACTLQRWRRSVLRMRTERDTYQRQRAAAICLQRRYRARRQMLTVRSQYLLIRSLIVCVQRKYRARLEMRKERASFLLLRRTVIFLQDKRRSIVAARQTHEWYGRLQSSTCSFQARARGLLGRRRFQALMTPEWKLLVQQKRAARVIQRYWRGYRSRKRFHNVRIAIIRKNLVLLQKTSKAVNSIRSKLQHAVCLLRSRYSISEALNVLTQLERLSRTVPHLLMGQSKFIASFCYGIMSQASRSEADKQLIELCGFIILNLARYDSTTAHTFQRGGLTTIAQMLLRWCDKDTNIFNTLCTLIWIFAQCPDKREIIRRFMTTTEAIYFVTETKILVARKEKMKANLRQPFSGHPTLHRSIVGLPERMTSGQRPQFHKCALPSLQPDYGIIRRQPYIFLSSVYAFNTILCKLNIKLSEQGPCV